MKNNNPVALILNYDWKEFDLKLRPDYDNCPLLKEELSVQPCTASRSRSDLERELIRHFVSCHIEIFSCSYFRDGKIKDTWIYSIKIKNLFVAKSS